MTNLAVIITSFFLFVLCLFPPAAFTAEIAGPDVTILGNHVIVSTGLTELAEIEAAIKRGIEKEIVFTIELFRVWRFWPDEFVVSKKIRKTIKYDNLRERYSLSSYDGTTRNDKKFTDFNIMKKQAFTVQDITLANIRELDPGSYYVRVVVESKSREISRAIGLLMLFIPEVEMSLAKESRTQHKVHEPR